MPSTPAATGEQPFRSTYGRTTKSEVNWRRALAIDGYAVLPGVDLPTVRALIAAVEQAGAAGRQLHGAVYAIRSLLEAVPAVSDYARSPAALELVRPILGPDCFPVRGLLFDKTLEANWNVLLEFAFGPLPGGLEWHLGARV